MKSAVLFAICLLACASALPAQTPAPVAPAAATDAATPLAPADLDALRTHVGATVDVRGTPTGTGHNKSGSIAYLNFGKAHAAVSAVAFLKNDGAGGDPAVHKVQGEDDLKPFVGKSVVVHGKLSDYKGDLQIVLDSLDQIKTAP